MSNVVIPDLGSPLWEQGMRTGRSSAPGAAGASRVQTYFDVNVYVYLCMYMYIYIYIYILMIVLLKLLLLLLLVVVVL